MYLVGTFWTNALSKIVVWSALNSFIFICLFSHFWPNQLTEGFHTSTNHILPQPLCAKIMLFLSNFKPVPFTCCQLLLGSRIDATHLHPLSSEPAVQWVHQWDHQESHSTSGPSIASAKMFFNPHWGIQDYIMMGLITTESSHMFSNVYIVLTTVYQIY